MNKCKQLKKKKSKKIIIEKSKVSNIIYIYIKNKIFFTKKNTKQQQS